MKFSTAIGALSTFAMMALSRAEDLPSIEVVGNKFFYSNNGSQFYIKGVAYQSNSLVNVTSSQTFSDPLADGDSCKRDIPYLLDLHTNVVRVYAINASLDHSSCMQQFSDAGIYVIADLSEPGLSINRAAPSWDVSLYTRYTEAVDALANYSNVLGFFAGNEVINAVNNTNSAPFVKAAIRDTKAYIKSKNYRNIPVGYAATDDAGPRVPEAHYFACGDEDERADFFGVNIYEWCGDSTFEESGYAARTKDYSNLGIPLFFSEYGCNAVQPRKFTEVQALYGSNMTDVWSGGIVYMYFQEENDYGLVSIGSDDKVTTMDDFGYLASELASITPTSGKASEVSATATTTVDCPASTLTNWNAATVLPPSPNADVCNCLDSGAACAIKDSVDTEDYEDIFGYICSASPDACLGIAKNGSTGEYGSFAGCNPKEQLNWVMNAYYSANSKDSSACDFSGSGTVLTPSTDSACKAVFSQAGSSATGTLTNGAAAGSVATAGAATGGSAQATGTGKSTGKGSSSGSASSSSSSAASSSSSSKKNAAASNKMPVAAGILAAAGAILMAGVF